MSVNIVVSLTHILHAALCIKHVLIMNVNCEHTHFSDTNAGENGGGCFVGNIVKHVASSMLASLRK